MTPKEIADHLLAQTTLTEEIMEPMLAYRRAKRATGAPVDLEDAIIHAAHKMLEAEAELRTHLERARKEATEALEAMTRNGLRVGDYSLTWFVLDGRQTAQGLHETLRAARSAFRSILEAWAAVADRIVATDEDRAQKAAENRSRAIAQFATLSTRELRSLARARGLHAGVDRREIAEALVDAGVAP